MKSEKEDEGEDFALDIDDLAKKSKVGRTKIYDEIKHGRLKARKIGRRTLILAEDARAWLAAAPVMSRGEAQQQIAA